MKESKIASSTVRKFMYYYLMCLSICLFACKEKDKRQPIEVEKPTVNTSDLTAKLITHYIANPSRQPEIDQNQIIDYAIEQNLDVQRSDSGLYYVILKQGTGKRPNRGSTIVVHYEGKLLSGQIFDSSIDRKKPLTSRLYKMIRGWEEGLQLIQEGGKIILLIPSRLAYGEEGFEDKIAPHTPLAFEIDLLEVSEKKHRR